MIKTRCFLLILFAITGTALFTACEQHPPEQTALFLKKSYGDGHGKKADAHDDKGHQEKGHGEKDHAHPAAGHEDSPEQPAAAPSPEPKKSAPLFPPPSASSETR